MDREFLVIGWRATSKEAAELEQKVKASGLTRSEFLRRLVAAAEVQPAQIRINRHDAQNLTGSSITAVAA